MAARALVSEPDEFFFYPFVFVLFPIAKRACKHRHWPFFVREVSVRKPWGGADRESEKEEEEKEEEEEAGHSG